MNLQIVPATVFDAIALGPSLRASDRHEVWASAGMGPTQALAESVKVSDEDMRWTALLNGHPEVMWGVARVTDDIGGMWLLASDKLKVLVRHFLPRSLEYVGIMHTRYEYLTNYIHHANLKSMSWLKRLGFYECETDPHYGYLRESFTRYESRRGHDYASLLPMRESQATLGVLTGKPANQPLAA